jgi:hypothetical protein
LKNRIRKGAALGLGLAVFVAGWVGCFTEAGNAEDDNLIQADFNIDYGANPSQLPKVSVGANLDSLVILQFSLAVKEAEYRAFDSASDRIYEMHLWKADSGGVPVDFTGANGPNTLPAISVAPVTATDLELESFLPEPSLLSPDTLVFASFHDRGYIKGVRFDGSSRFNFLFALPSGKELHLLYSQQALASWYSGNAYRCEFTFFGMKWLSGTDFRKADVWDDRTGADVAIFDANHNAAMYQSLLDSFYQSFNTARVSTSL